MSHVRLAALALFMSAPLLAQSDLQVVTLLHPAFLPHDESTAYFSVCCASPTDSYRNPTAGAQAFVLPLHAGIIPDGARVVRIDLFVRDATAAADANFGFSFCRTWIGLDGVFGGSDCPGDLFSSGAPGDTALTIEPDHTVRYGGIDADGDGDEDAVAYTITVTFGTGGIPHYTNAMRLRGVRLLYQRQVAPAPAVATFNDVPTSHLFFQFVEALASSGITAGCGTGIYCPDSPLTRGQMAVFLAKALGLHWPAIVP